MKLSYFDIAGGRGEDCRLALHIAGVEFEDDRIVRKDWPAKKPTTPYGGMPVLEIEGVGTLAQSNAILGLLGARYGLIPKDDFQAAKHHAMMHSVEDVRCLVTRTTLITDEAERKKAREELSHGYLTDWAKNIDSQIEGPFIAGATIGVADLKLFVMMKGVISGTYDGIPANLFDDHKKLTGLYNAVKSHPKVVEWYSAKGD